MVLGLARAENVDLERVPLRALMPALHTLEHHHLQQQQQQLAQQDSTMNLSATASTTSNTVAPLVAARRAAAAAAAAAVLAEWFLFHLHTTFQWHHFLDSGCEHLTLSQCNDSDVLAVPAR